MISKLDCLNQFILPMIAAYLCIFTHQLLYGFSTFNSILKGLGYIKFNHTYFKYHKSALMSSKEWILQNNIL